MPHRESHMDWYYKNADQKVGPVDDDQIRELAKQGIITSGTLVWNELISQWRTYGDITGQGPSRTQSAINAPAASPAQVNAAPATSDEVFDPYNYENENRHAAETAASPGTAAGAEAESADSIKMVGCSECGRAFPDAELVHYGDSSICAECKPAFFQKLMEGAETSGTFRYGGFWIRFVAKFVDGLILWVVGMLITVLAGFSIFGRHSAFTMTPARLALYIFINLLQFAIGISYSTFLVGKYGATLGKMIFGLKIVMPDGGRVTYLRALGRHFAEWISGMTLLIGYIMAGFDDEKRALHDRICATRVIRKSA